jgi:hypothetical protein
MRPPWDSVNDFLQLYPGSFNQGLDPANLRDQFFPASAFVQANTFSMPGSSSTIKGAWSVDEGDNTMDAAQQEPRLYATKGKATLNFNGTALVLRIELDYGWGSASIYIDGQKPSTMGLKTALDTLTSNVDTATYPGLNGDGAHQYLDVLVADGLTPGLHKVDVYANNSGADAFFVLAGAKVRSYNKQPLMLSGWKATGQNKGRFSLANKGTQNALSVSLSLPAALTKQDGSAFPTPVTIGTIAPGTQFDLDYMVDGTGQADNVAFPLYLSGLYRDPAGAVQVSTPFAYLMTSNVLTFGPNSSAWSVDTATPDGSTRVISNGANKTISFSTAATSLDFTLMRDFGWGTASVTVAGVNYGTLTSNDATGGGFLAVQTISGLPAGLKTVVITSLLAASKPFVMTQIAGTSVDMYSQVNETIFLNYSFNGIPPFAVDSWVDPILGVQWQNPDPSRKDLTLPRDNATVKGANAYARFPTFAVYYQSGKHSLLADYDLVVIDPNGVSAKEVADFQSRGIKVLGYVSFGEEDGVLQDIYNPTSPLGPYVDDGQGTGGYASYYNKGGNGFGEPNECNLDLQRTQGLKQCQIGRAEYFTGRGRCSLACTFDSRAGYVTQSAGGKCGGGFTSANNWQRDAMSACTNSSCSKYTPVNKKCPKWTAPDVGWGQDFALTEDFPDQNGIWGSTFVNPLAPRWKQKLQTQYLPTVLNAPVKHTNELKTIAAYGASQFSFRANDWPIDDAEDLILTSADGTFTYKLNLDYNYDKVTGAFTLPTNAGVDAGHAALTAGSNLLLTYTRKGLQCDGLFMDTVDTVDVYPSAQFQQAMADVINSLKALWPNALFCSNRGFTVLPKIISSCSYVMFESWLVDYNFDTGIYSPITDPDSIEFNQGIKTMLRELRRDHIFDVLSLNYCSNGPDGDALRQFIFDTNMAEGFMSWSSTINLDDPLPNNPMQTTVAAAIRSNVWALLRHGGLTDGTPHR